MDKLKPASERQSRPEPLAGARNYGEDSPSVAEIGCCIDCGSGQTACDGICYLVLCNTCHF